MRRILGPLLEAVVLFGVAAFLLRWVLNLFGQQRTVFQVMYWRSVYLLAWPLASLAVGLPFLATFFTGAHSGWALMLLLVAGALLLSFSVPAFALHLQYYLCNRHTTLLFDPKKNILEVYEGPYRQYFERRDIAQVERVTCHSQHLFWSHYDYLRLHLRDGRVLTLTSLLLKLDNTAEFLRSLPQERRQRWLCWL
jgi:hypothetical protein